MTLRSGATCHLRGLWVKRSELGNYKSELPVPHAECFLWPLPHKGIIFWHRHECKHGLQRGATRGLQDRADTIAQPWMWVLSKHDFRSRKLFEGQTTKELTAKNLWARKMWKVILSCLFHNKTLSVTYPANSSEFTAENAGGYLLPLHRGSKSCMNALHDVDEWHTCKRPGNPQWERSLRKYSARLAKDTHSSLSIFVTIHLPWRNKMSRK